MNPKEPRTIWLVTENGIPSHGAWAMVKTHQEALELYPDKPSWASALDEAESTNPAFNATPTVWRRMPRLIQPHATRALSKRPSLNGRRVDIAGLRYELDRGGRVHPGHTPGDPMEPLVPDAEVVDEDDLLQAAEDLGDIRFVEHGSRRNWRVTTKPSQTRKSEDVLLHRVNGQRRRENKPVE